MLGSNARTSEEPASRVRVVVAHNRYRTAGGPSGENLAVAEDVALLRGADVDVVELVRSSDDLDRLGPVARVAAGLSAVHHRGAAEALRAVIAEAPVDVLHIHNVYPLLSPSVVAAALEAGVAVVQTLHNYRHRCMAGTFFRDGRVCTDCGPARPFPGVQHGCYRDSRAQSAVMATALLARRSTWRRVDHFVALTPFMRDFVVEALDVPASRTSVRPTPVADPGPPAPRPAGDDVLFVGRLDAYKGVLRLLDAWSLLGEARRGHRLVIVGDGDERAEVERRAACDDTIVVAGSRDADDVGRAYRQARVVVVPSLLFEGYPRVVAEAFAHGVPVIASDLGSLGTVVPAAAGWTCTPEPAELASALRVALTEEGTERRREARAAYDAALSPTASLALLLEAYDAACRHRAAA
jgi:glycosyltransferase involved in cell wall biosynthesis